MLTVLSHLSTSFVSLRTEKSTEGQQSSEESLRRHPTTRSSIVPSLVSRNAVACTTLKKIAQSRLWFRRFDTDSPEELPCVMLIAKLLANIATPQEEKKESSGLTKVPREKCVAMQSRSSGGSRTELSTEGKPPDKYVGSVWTKSVSSSRLRRCKAPRSRWMTVHRIFAGNPLARKSRRHFEKRGYCAP